MAAALLGCAQVGGGPPIVPPGEPAQPVGASASQSLYRVRYSGPEGDGSLRLVLRQVTPVSFQLLASDTFGRQLWGLDLAADEALLIDHRRREACRAGSELRVPEVALRPLPLPAVARVLASQTPLEAPPGADPTDWTDATGQRWTARWQERQLTAWTMWQAGEPRLWWLRQPGGGVLSHRDGSQFRWRQAAREELPPAGYRRLEVPPEYRFGECRIEAPGPAGEGPAAG